MFRVFVEAFTFSVGLAWLARCVLPHNRTSAEHPYYARTHPGQLVLPPVVPTEVPTEVPPYYIRSSTDVPRLVLFTSLCSQRTHGVRISFVR